ncbi:MAG: hypothetical protein Q8K45_15150 [Rubrivivax sp.]|nr:hypothetical protein [Rubrivivax sp.]
MTSRSIIAVITAYKPDDAFLSRFSPLLEICRNVIVSDNTPGGHKSFDLPTGFVVLQHLTNSGLGPALNAGITEARRCGATEIILFDQDSTPDANFVLAMADQLAKAQVTQGRRCCVGPTHLDDDTGASVSQPLSRRSHVDFPASDLVSCLPTSGLIFSVDALELVDKFSDDFFLDLVDFEWCWRLGAKGWRFFRSREVTMLHRLGIAERRMFGVTFHVPAPYRHYFQVRDALKLFSRNYVPIYSKCRLIGILPLKALIYPFILDRGAERLQWMLRGAYDGFRGVAGIGSAASRLGN